MNIDGGANAGKYFVRAGINMSAITLSFHDDEDIAGGRRLGSGGISFKREWLHYEAHEMRPTPPEVEQDYKRQNSLLLPREHASCSSYSSRRFSSRSSAT